MSSSATSLRLPSLLAACLTVTLAGCGGTKPAPTAPAPANDEGGAGGGGRVMAPGSSGLPGLDWGATADAVTALYPRATASEGGLVAMGMTDGHQSLTQFTIGASGLAGVQIEWVEGYASMEACLEGWALVRTKVDERLGASSAENGAAYWDLPAASVTLACNPNDNGAGVLSQTFTPREGE